MPKEAPRWVDRDLMSVAGGMAFGLFLLFLVVSGSGTARQDTAAGIRSSVVAPAPPG